MRRVLLLITGAAALVCTLLTTACGPGLLALGGGGTGTFFGLQGGDDEGGGKKPPKPNIVPAVIVTSVMRGETPVSVQYTILDGDNDPCSIEMQYSLNGTDFFGCFQGAGGDGVTGLSSSQAGVPHTFSWDFVADFGSPAYQAGIGIRARANDGDTTGEWFELAGTTVGNDAPTITNLDWPNDNPPGGICVIQFDVVDDNSDLSSFEIFYSVDQGQNFIAVDIDPMSPTYELIGIPPVNLASSPAGTPNQLIWDSNIALSGLTDGIQMKLIPRDNPPGYSAETIGAPVLIGPWLLDNYVNQPPVLQITGALAGQTFKAVVPIEINLSDVDSDSAAVSVDYTLNGGLTPQDWFPATLLNQFTPGEAGPFSCVPSPTVYNLYWNARADIGAISPYVNNYSNVLLRLKPADGAEGLEQISDPFNIKGNTAPEVLSVEALQPGGNVTVAVVLEDHNADPVSALIEYSTDGSAYTTLTTADFLAQGANPNNLASSNIGVSNLLVWNTSLRFPGANAASVYLRVTPTDHPSGATPAGDETGPPFVSPPFPVINNPSGADPVSISIITTNSGGTPTATPVVTVANTGVNNTVYFDRVVNPASSTVQDTFWKINESGPQWGTLETVAGAPLSFAAGGFTLNGTVVPGDTIDIHDGIHSAVTFQFWDGVSQLTINAPVDISGLTTADDFADALVTAINGHQQVRLRATHTGSGVIELVHEIACRIGNATSQDAQRGNASDIVASPASILAGPPTQLSGGAGTTTVRYVAPATRPQGSDYVEISCVIDHASFHAGVSKTHRLYWGNPVTSVGVVPPSTTQQVNAVINMTGVVQPVSAPQIVTWEVVGGSTNGTITPTGPATAQYNAPASTPGDTQLTVTVRAYSIDPNVASGVSTLTIRPDPASIVVTTPGNGALELGQTRQYNAAVTPAAAPQGVNWSVIWNAQDFGSGNSTVGTISASGLYTTPLALISPAEITIRAKSQIKPTVLGTYVQALIAPAPTSFQVSPATANVSPGGAGVQFSAVNFNPVYANPSVTWSLSNSNGAISQGGFYTPPAAPPIGQSSPALQTTVIATSNPNNAIVATAAVSIAAFVYTPPASVTVAPAAGYTFSGGPKVQFTHQVLPLAAFQNVTWSVIAGGGSITQAGLYTPPATSVDLTATILCANNENPSINRQVNICIAGDGRNWNSVDSIELSRAGPNMVWDTFNSRMWMIGGRTPVSGSAAHDRNTLYISVPGSVLAEGPAIGGIAYIGTEPTSIAAAFDSANNRILAILGKGNSSVEVWQLNVTQTTPGWVKMTVPASGTIPTLPKVHTYHAWYDTARNELHVLKDRASLYRFSCSSNQWLTGVTLNNQGSGPSLVELCGHGWNGGADRHYFVGPTSATSSTTKLFGLSVSSATWIEHSPQPGAQPGFGISNPSVVWVGDRVHVFGGVRNDNGQTVDSLYTVYPNWHPGLLVIGAHWEADWAQIPKGGTEERPLGRGDGGLAAAGSNGYIFYGGEVGRGSFGDFWSYRPGQSPPFIPFSTGNMRPQGRRDSAGVLVGGVIYTYGGLASHGASNDLWRLNYNETTKAATWTRLQPTGAVPPPLHGATMVYDANNNRILMFGGDEGGASPAVYSNKLYQYSVSTNQWTLLNPSGGAPSPRRGAAMCYDGDNRRVWVFGGEGSGGKFKDLYYLDVNATPGTWNTVSGMTGSIPDERVFATIGWDTINQRLLVIGGDSSVSGPNAQLYEYLPAAAQKKWTALSIINIGTGQPENVCFSGAIWDAACGRFVHAPGKALKAQAVVMTSAGAHWHHLATPTASGTAGSTGLYDAAAQRYFMLFGERAAGNIGTNGVRNVDFK